jgi:hypothetical protein
MFVGITVPMRQAEKRYLSKFSATRLVMPREQAIRGAVMVSVNGI